MRKFLSFMKDLFDFSIPNLSEKFYITTEETPDGNLITLTPKGNSK